MATATFTEVEDRSIGQQLSEAIWDDQIRDNVNQLAGAHRNLLVNGGYEVWQRGAGSFTAVGGVWTADRWRYYDAGLSGTIAITRESSTKATDSVYSLKAVFTRVGVNGILTQLIEDYTQLRGRTVSLSMKVHQSVASSCRLFITDSTGTTTSATSATTGSFVTLTATRALGSGITSLEVGVEFTASGTFHLDNAMLVIGPAPAPYQPLTPQEDLARCQRYYEVHGGVNGSMAFGGYGVATAGYYLWLPFAVRKGGTPTVTKNGTWNVVGCPQPAINGAFPDGYGLTVTPSGTGGFVFNCNGTDDTITAEWNP